MAKDSRTQSSRKLRLAPSDRRDLIGRLQADGASLAARFGLHYTAIEAEDARVRRRYGSCHSDGVIRIRLTHAKTGRPLKYSSMIDTLCHELAHLKYFHHGPSFRDFYEVILDWARRERIYRPTPRGSRQEASARDLAAAGLAEQHSQAAPDTPPDASPRIGRSRPRRSNPSLQLGLF